MEGEVARVCVGCAGGGVWHVGSRQRLRSSSQSVVSQQVQKRLRLGGLCIHSAVVGVAHTVPKAAAKAHKLCHKHIGEAAEYQMISPKGCEPGNPKTYGRTGAMAQSSTHMCVEQ